MLGKRRKRSPGFTFIEMAITLFLIGVLVPLATSVFYMFTKAPPNETDKLFTINEVSTAIDWISMDGMRAEDFTPTMVTSSSEYDFSVGAGSLHKAWDYGQENMPSGPTDYGAVCSDYTLIEAESDGKTWVTDKMSGDQYDHHYNIQMYKFEIDDDEASVLKLEVKWRGYGENETGYDTSLYIWDYSGSQWIQLDTQVPMGSMGWLTGEITNNIGDYIDSYYITTLARAEHYEAPDCPSLFGWNGEGYEFIEGVMSTSIVKRYEMPFYATDTTLEPKDGYYDLIVAEPFEERAYINDLNLWIVDHPDGTKVWPDQTGNLHTIRDPQPVTVTDQYGEDITPFTMEMDSLQWSSDLKGRDFENPDDIFDCITITLPQERDEGTAKLLLDVGQTPLVDLAAWYYFHGFMGTPNLDLVIDLSENDEEFISIADMTFANIAGVVLQVWDGTDWVDYEYLSSYPADTNEHLYVIPIDMSQIEGDQVRLISSAGWLKYNYAAVDYTPNEAVVVKELLPVGATEYYPDGSTKNVLSQIADTDNSYAILEQGDYVNIKFSVPQPPADGLTRSFVIPASGYYYKTGSEVPLNKIENLPLMEEVLATPYGYNVWMLQRYVNPDDYPYTEYYNVSVTSMPFPVVRPQSLVTDYIIIELSTEVEVEDSYGTFYWQDITGATAISHTVDYYWENENLMRQELIEEAGEDDIVTRIAIAQNVLTMEDAAFDYDGDRLTVTLNIQGDLYTKELSIYINPRPQPIED